MWCAGRSQGQETTLDASCVREGTESHKGYENSLRGSQVFHLEHLCHYPLVVLCLSVPRSARVADLIPAPPRDDGQSAIFLRATRARIWGFWEPGLL